MLSPILQRERILRPQQVSALAAGIILFNSVAALSGEVIAAAGDELRGLTEGCLRLITGVLLLSASLRVLV